jgi:hypothetical protein
MIYQAKEPTPDQEIHALQRAIHLMLILFLTALGSFTLAPYLLPLPPQQASHRHAPDQYTDGACTAQLQTIHYAQHTTSNQKVPTAWIQTGTNSTQFALAQACVAAFTITYESINISQPASLSAVISMLSSTGKKSFFEGNAMRREDLHMNPSWQLEARKEHLQQSAQLIKKAQLLTVHASPAPLFVTFTIKYRLIIKISGKSTNQPEQLAVVLEKAPATLSKATKSTGWQVVDWHVSAP